MGACEEDRHAFELPALNERIFALARGVHLIKGRGACFYKDECFFSP